MTSEARYFLIRSEQTRLDGVEGIWGHYYDNGTDAILALRSAQEGGNEEARLVRIDPLRKW